MDALMCSLLLTEIMGKNKAGAYSFLLGAGQACAVDVE
ncbi:hypothetical protein PAECIP112173_04316 [Paenibacillus sp. JJ-100]|nr:hypothetical protein PAECIP112173_04316 [Paenibacillus sp. JJ-100]